MIRSAQRVEKGLNERAIFCSPANFFLLTNKLFSAYQQNFFCSPAEYRMLAGNGTAIPGQGDRRVTAHR
ncbi:hypothetical protein HMPREF0658_0698 [Hoylesella marshii DSM 16973 = JCM 13450]|uniref:Uncharacterized protein n=1 Tax=Hoylesella marshii DSM 16973 = JCM 13450 TaxID=862515 RepID=E0NR97_9BACT|nr:hypothetical protein HMPREF0658_0698 [Hoylesella marshii DSM 16973 = JCM 13450]